MESNFTFLTNVNGVKFHYSQIKDIDEHEIHPYHEFLYYLGEDAIFCTEKFKQKLTHNCLIFIPKDKYHSFLLDDPKNFKRLKISFSDTELNLLEKKEHLSEIKILTSSSSIIFTLLEKVCTFLNSNKPTKENLLFMYGAFLLVLSEFFNSVDAPEVNQKLSPAVKSCILHVEKHLSNDLSIKSIGINTGFSPSTISHLFKKELGISLHAYILQKRMIYAKTLLEGGISPTEVYLLCGYTNYSSFYKSYVKFFKKRPKDR